MKAVGYFLVNSAPAEGSESGSAEVEKAFLSSCELQGFEPVATFTEVVASAEAERPQYREMLRYLRQPGREFTIIVTQRLGDLAENPRDVVQRILELEELGTRVMCLEEGAGEPLARALEAWSEDKRKDTTGELVKAGMRNKAIRGFGLGKPPFGYCIGLNHRFEIVPEEEAMWRFFQKMLREEQIKMYERTRELDFSHEVAGVCRVRVNLYLERGRFCASIRKIT